MLLTSLKSSSAPDIADAVSIGGTTLSRSDLVGAATAVAERVAGPRPGGGAGDADDRHGAGGDGLPDRRCAVRSGARRRRRRRTHPHPDRFGGAGVAGRTAPTTSRAWRTFRSGCTPGPGTATPSRRRTPRPTSCTPPAPPARPRECRPADVRSPPTSTRWRRRGSGHPTTSWCTACRCSTCTAWCWVCSDRCGSEIASCTPVNPRRRHTRRPRSAGGTLFFGVPTVWSRVVADTGRGRRVARRPIAGVGKRGAAGAGVRRPGRADRPCPGRAVRKHRIADHPEHAGRR